MSTETTAAVSQQSPASANWDALVTDTVPVSTTETKAETPAATTEAAATTETPTLTPEQILEETPKAEETPATAETTEKPSEDGLGLSLSIEDIDNVPKTYAEGSAQWIAQELGLSLDKEDVGELKKALTEKFVPIDKFEEVKKSTTENLYSQLDPKIATAFKLIELGVDQSMALNPTSQHEYLLGLDNNQLLRMKLEANPNYDADMVDAQMEQWVAEDKIDTLAKIEKANLEQERQQILNTQSQLIQQYSEQKKQAEVVAKQQADQKFLEVLDKVPEFIGAPLTKEIKAAIAAKYKSGGYDNVLNDAQNKVMAVLHHQFGKKFQEAMLAKAKASGRAEVVRQLSDVPIQKGNGAGRVITNANDQYSNPADEQWAAFRD